MLLLLLKNKKTTFSEPKERKMYNITAAKLNSAQRSRIIVINKEDNRNKNYADKSDSSPHIHLSIIHPFIKCSSSSLNRYQLIVDIPFKILLYILKFPLI